MKPPSDDWHKTMYDRYLARTTIASEEFQNVAKKEAAFMIAKLCLSPGDRLLDIPCGTGRHAAVFADYGIEVTGIDINEECLKLAVMACRGKKVALEQADMRKLGRHHRGYDAVVNLFTSFGYFATDQKNERVLKLLISALRPGGQIAINTANRDFVLKNLPTGEWREEGRKLILEARRYDAVTHYREAKLVIVDRKSAKARTYYYRVRLYSKQEMINLMKRCGLCDIRVFGNFDGHVFNRFQSSLPIYIGRKSDHSPRLTARVNRHSVQSMGFCKLTA
jgi:SAM-dependent methyltransferase